jgi:hypothetical protein
VGDFEVKEFILSFIKSAEIGYIYTGTSHRGWLNDGGRLRSSMSIAKLRGRGICHPLFSWVSYPPWFGQERNEGIVEVRQISCSGRGHKGTCSSDLQLLKKLDVMLFLDAFPFSMLYFEYFSKKSHQLLILHPERYTFW